MKITRWHFGFRDGMYYIEPNPNGVFCWISELPIEIQTEYFEPRPPSPPSDDADE